MKPTAEQTKQEIMRLEELLLSPEVRSSRTELEAMLADEFFEIGSSGRLWNKSQVIEALGTESGLHFSIDDFCTRALTDNLVLATYRCMRESAGDRRRSLRCSIWRLQGGRWQMIFHQGTPVPDDRRT